MLPWELGSWDEGGCAGAEADTPDLSIKAVCERSPKERASCGTCCGRNGEDVGDKSRAQLPFFPAVLAVHKPAGFRQT